MKAQLAASAVVLAAMLCSLPGTAPALADPGADSGTGVAGTPGPQGRSYSIPFVDHTEWARWGRLTTLRVHPTPSGRAASRRLPPAAADEAWAEVLALSPDADTAGMRAQFSCHWKFAEVGQPGKASWNLEPWRPVVDDSEMLATGCNPGNTEAGAPPAGGGPY